MLAAEALGRNKFFRVYLLQSNCICKRKSRFLQHEVVMELAECHATEMTLPRFEYSSTTLGVSAVVNVMPLIYPRVL